MTAQQDRARLVAATVRSLATALTGIVDQAAPVIEQLGELADLVDPDAPAVTP